jgi:hypothetical protein
MYSKKKNHDILLQILEMLKENQPNGLKRGKIDAKFTYVKEEKLPPQRKGSTYPLGKYNDYASKPTISLAIMQGIKQGSIIFDKMTNTYKITGAGEKYLEKFWLADMVLSCNHWDSRFIYPNPLEQKEPALTISWLNQSDIADAGHSIALLKFRDEKRQAPLLDSFLSDVIDYAVNSQLVDNEISALLAKLQKGKYTLEERALFTVRLKEVWEKMFKGVKRVITLQEVNPQLMLERITAELA